MSKNRITIKHLMLACKHVRELMGAGLTENLAIRTLELFTDVYAKLHTGGSPTPHHVSQVPYKQWSAAAKEWKRNNPDTKATGFLIVEHGTPRRPFARKVIELYRNKKLNEAEMALLVKKYWRLAVLTIEEDRLLNSKFRTIAFTSPKKRWEAGGIKFDSSQI